jgi:hypothetical protein
MTDSYRDNQGELSENISIQLAGQSQLIRDAFSYLQADSARTQAIIQGDTVKVLASLFPIAASVTYVANTIPNMEESLSRLVWNSLLSAIKHFLMIARKQRLIA